MLSKILDYTDLGISSLEILFFPVEEGANMAETEVPFVSTVSKVLAGVGMISTILSLIILYEKHAKIHWMLKWILVPLVILDVALVALLLGLAGPGPSKLKAAGQWAVKYLLPAAYTLGGGALLVMMAVLPKHFLKVSYIGKAIYYLPGALGYPPINKHPFYTLVILVRTGGIITTVVGGMIELAEGESDTDTE